MSNKIGLKKYPESFEPKARAAPDDHVRDDEALFAIGVMDEGELQEKYDDLVRAAEQCMRQRNALWLRLSVFDGPGAAAVVDVDEVERSCNAIGPFFSPPPPSDLGPAPSKPAASWLTTTCKQGEACRGCAEPDCAAPWYVREPDPWALPSPWAWGRDSTRDWYAYASTAVDVVGVYWDGDDCSTLALDSACEVVGAPDEVHELVRRRNLADRAPIPAGPGVSAVLDCRISDVEDRLDAIATAFEDEAKEFGGPVARALGNLAVRLRGVR